jgi:hypothetical protein
MMIGFDCNQVYHMRNIFHVVVVCMMQPTDSVLHTVLAQSDESAYNGGGGTSKPYLHQYWRALALLRSSSRITF